MSKVKNMKQKAPIDCTFHELCKIKSDNCDAGDYWTITDGNEVTFTHQKLGKKSTEKISIPVKIARRLIKFLMTPQGIGRAV